MVDPKLYTPVEIAKLLSVKVDTVQTWLRTGKIQGVKLPGGDWRVRQEDLEAMLKQQQ